MSRWLLVRSANRFPALFNHRINFPRSPTYTSRSFISVHFIRFYPLFHSVLFYVISLDAVSFYLFSIIAGEQVRESVTDTLAGREEGVRGGEAWTSVPETANENSREKWDERNFSAFHLSLISLLSVCACVCFFLFCSRAPSLSLSLFSFSFSVPHCLFLASSFFFFFCSSFLFFLFLVGGLIRRHAGTSTRENRGFFSSFARTGSFDLPAIDV